MLKDAKIGKKLLVSFGVILAINLVNAIIFILLFTMKVEEFGFNVRNTKDVWFITIGVEAVVVITAVFISIYLAKKMRTTIIAPVEQIAVAMNAMAEGDLNYHLEFTSKDEIGEVAEAYRRTTRTVGAYIADIDRAMKQMSEGDFNLKPSQKFIGDFENIENSITTFIVSMSVTLDDIKNSADMVDKASRQVAGGAQALAQGATEQASSLQELSASIAEVSGEIKANANNSNIAKQGADAANAGIMGSNEEMIKLMAAMEEINTSSTQIGKIIETIKDIAFQTNILALNAAVEAARAGAAGKGFMVVADEVRNLASKSAAAAANTTDLIESSITAVEKGVKLARATADILQNMAVGAEQTTQLIAEINQATAHQAVAIQQINLGVEQISAVVQTNSATSEESAAASEELSSQADIMKDMIDRFNLLQEALQGSNRMSSMAIGNFSEGKEKATRYYNGDKY